MKFKLFSTLGLSFTALALSAQLGMPTNVTNAEQNVQKTELQTQTTTTETINNASATAKTGLGTLISQFAGQVNSSALTDEFNKAKTTFQSQAKSTAATDVKANSSLLQKLESGLKSTAFTEGWAKIKDKWLSNVKTAATTKQLAGYLKTLTQNVDPKFLGKNWETFKPTFNMALDKMAQ